jgi:hypothetical protein
MNVNFFVDIKRICDTITELGWQQLSLNPERLKLKFPGSQGNQSFARSGGKNAKLQYEN